MMNNLLGYGFIQIKHNTFSKGEGSISNGRMVTVIIHGQTARVIVERWLCNGDIEQDERQEWTCWLANVWEYIPEWAVK